jgi:toxin YoeB
MSKITFTERAFAEYLYWQSQDKKTLKRINALLKDISCSPYEGIGKPEGLKENLSGYWSRREPDPTVVPQSGSTPAPTPSSQSNSGVSEEDAKWAVYLIAEETIPKYLNCPSTMEMCLFRDCTIKDVGFNIWKGEGYFDAENLYGATVRSKWNITCTIKDGIIHLAKLKIDDIVVYNDGTQ